MLCQHSLFGLANSKVNVIALDFQIVFDRLGAVSPKFFPRSTWFLPTIRSKRYAKR